MCVCVCVCVSGRAIRNAYDPHTNSIVLEPNANHCVRGCITLDDCKTFAGNNLYQQNLLYTVGAALDS